VLHLPRAQRVRRAVPVQAPPVPEDCRSGPNGVLSEVKAEAARHSWAGIMVDGWKIEIKTFVKARLFRRS
jgi:hypothetical protein